MSNKFTLAKMLGRKGKEPVVCLTAYTAPMAEMLDPIVDVLLVGDSLGMVVYGEPTTLSVDIETMIRHGRAVARCAKQAMVVVDMPFGSYQVSPEQAFQNAARIMSETNCDAVKLEGGSEMASTVSFLTSRGVPVIGHIGMQPQSVQAYGGFKVQGKTKSSYDHIMKAASDLEDAGAFSLVLECVTEDLAYDVTSQVSIPVIGIGASSCCDGQILVTEDLLGLSTGSVPKFVKQYDALQERIKEACGTYAKDVKERHFPFEEHVYKKAS